MSILNVPVTQSSLPDWVRKVANAINQLIFGKQDANDNLTSIASLTLTGNSGDAIVVNGTEDGFELVAGGGGGGTTTNALTFNNAGSGAASGSTFDGSAAVTVSYNSVGAAASSHTHSQADITGLTTADSPQFTAINLGHASDTTLTRTGAGDAAIEGNAIYRAGGTDVPLADGGTGASLVDPNADRILFWDDSAGAVTWLSLDPGLEISGTTLRTARGTSFPGSPSSGDRFLRTDRNIEYFYDGTRWLSTELHQYMPSQTFGGQTATAQVGRQPVPFKGVYDIYLETWQTVAFLSQASSWDLNVRWANSANTFTTLGTVNTTGYSVNTWTSGSATINAVLSSSALLLDMQMVENSGTSTTSAFGILYFRLVG